jgi:hypothetical protein
MDILRITCTTIISVLIDGFHQRKAIPVRYEPYGYAVQ